MAKETSPFIGYSTEEVLASEAVAYTIQAGNDVFNVKGRFVFDKRTAKFYYNKILKEVLYQMQNGTDNQKSTAKSILSNLKILPLRIH